MGALKVFAGIWLAIGCVLMTLVLWVLFATGHRGAGWWNVVIVVAITAAGVSVPWIAGRARQRG